MVCKNFFRFFYGVPTRMGWNSVEITLLDIPSFPAIFFRPKNKKSLTQMGQALIIFGLIIFI